MSGAAAFARVVVLAVALLGTSGNAATAQAAEQVVARDARGGYLSAFGGAVAWSSYDSGTKRFRLEVRRGGRNRLLPIPGRKVPFDVDLGPGRGGGLSAVYSRCRDEGGFGPEAVPTALAVRGCDLFEYDFRSRRERRRSETARRGFDEVLPTIWRGRIAFARLSTTKRGYRPPRLLISTAGGAPRALRGGSRGREDRDLDEDGAAPLRLDLRGERLAFSWSLVAPDGSCLVDPRIGTSDAQELWIVGVDGGRRRRLGAGCEFDEVSGYEDVSLTERGLYATLRRRIEDGRPTEQQLVQRISRFSLPSGRSTERDLAPVVAAVQDGASTYSLRVERSDRVTLVRERLFDPQAQQARDSLLPGSMRRR